MTTTALLLAAGAGRRMGGPKALVRPDAGEATLVELAIARLVAGGCTEVHVVVGAAAEDVAALVRVAGQRVVTAADWDQGMGASLRAGLNALAHSEIDAVLIHLVDLLDVGAEPIARVRAAAGPGASVLARAAYDGRPGHPVVLGRDHWPAALRVAVGDRGARDLLSGPGVQLIECGDLARGVDADRPEDLPG